MSTIYSNPFRRANPRALSERLECIPKIGQVRFIWSGERVQDGVQHNEVGHSKLAHVQQGTHSLLEHGRPEATRRDGADWLHIHAVVLALPALRSRLLLGWAGGSTEISAAAAAAAVDVGGMLTDEQGVVLLDHPAQQLEEHDEEQHADARPCEHAAARDVP